MRCILKRKLFFATDVVSAAETSNSSRTRKVLIERRWKRNMLKDLRRRPVLFTCPIATHLVQSPGKEVQMSNRKSAKHDVNYF